jgi:hypothetical protein
MRIDCSKRPFNKPIQTIYISSTFLPDPVSKQSVLCVGLCGISDEGLYTRVLMR